MTCDKPCEMVFKKIVLGGLLLEQILNPIRFAHATDFKVSWVWNDKCNCQLTGVDGNRIITWKVKWPNE